MNKDKLNEIAMAAFAELDEVIEQNGMKPKDNSLAMARSTAAGNVNRKGKKIRLGLERVLRLINQYAPDAFDIQIQIKKK